MIQGEKIEVGHPRLLIPELCSLMYHQGWVTGTGGGMSIKKEYVGLLFHLVRTEADTTNSNRFAS